MIDKFSSYFNNATLIIFLMFLGIMISGDILIGSVIGIISFVWSWFIVEVLLSKLRKNKNKQSKVEVFESQQLLRVAAICEIILKVSDKDEVTVIKTREPNHGIPLDYYDFFTKYNRKDGLLTDTIIEEDNEYWIVYKEDNYKEYMKKKLNI